MAFRRACILMLLCLMGAGWTAPGALAQDTERLDQAGLIGLINGTSAQIVVVSFWATWCGPCIKEFPNLIRLRQEYGEEEVAIIAVSFDFDANAYTEFLASNPVNFETYLGTDTLMADLGIESIPNLWLMNRCGTLLGGIDGLTDYEELDRTIRQALSMSREADNT